MNEVIYLMVAMALCLAVGFVLSYIWALNEGQFDDLTTPALRILKDDSVSDKKEERKQS